MIDSLIKKTGYYKPVDIHDGAVGMASREMREDVLLPREPGSESGVFTDLESGLALPPWHCCFRDCGRCANSNNEADE